MKRHILIPISIILGLAIFGLIYAARQQPTVSNKLSVVTSFYPLAYFAGQVGGSLVTVTNITPAGSEPHDFEPTARDIGKINQSNLFIYNGNGLDPWADKTTAQQVLKMSDRISSVDNDPHFWLDSVLAQQEVASIRDSLIAIDPANKTNYQDNAQYLDTQLTTLDQQYRSGLATCQRHEIVTSHAAFGYLARRYNLTQIALAGLSPDEEPSPQKLVEITNLVRQKNIQYIFYEELVSPKLSETIAKETGAKTIAFNPLEGLTDEQIKNGQTYLSIMSENLTHLQTALQCH